MLEVPYLRRHIRGVISEVSYQRSNIGDVILERDTRGVILETPGRLLGSVWRASGKQLGGGDGSTCEPYSDDRFTK